jgi:dihydroorotate dehydrogenase
MYSLIRKVLFCLDAETSHDFSLEMMGAGERLGLVKAFSKTLADQPVEVMGIQFPNPVGLAAGLDKNGDYFNALGNLGFGFVEIGTVTPRPQPGNPQPRLFRLPKVNGIINRMGFNNKGVDHLIEQVKKRRFKGVLGINIGKNFDTPVENAVDDYRIGMQKVYAHADYITVNVSSPNTPGLRDLQFGESLNQLLAALKLEQLALAEIHGRYVPVAVKIAPDMNEEEVKGVAQSLLSQKIDAVIATNTTVDRDQVEGLEHGDELGGLSGGPVKDKSTQVIRWLSEELGDQLPIIGVGGIVSGRDAAEKFEAGASLVQVYSGFIYRGPELIAESLNAIKGSK